jgi:hypothetical protein
MRPLELVPSGAARDLPGRILGASAEPFRDDFPADPAEVAALGSMHLAYTRYPGGSQGNNYDWKSGLFTITDRLSSASWSGGGRPSRGGRLPYSLLHPPVSASNRGP